MVYRDGEPPWVRSLPGLDVANPVFEGVVLALEGLELADEFPRPHPIAVLLRPDQHAHEGAAFLQVLTRVALRALVARHPQEALFGGIREELAVESSLARRVDDALDFPALFLQEVDDGGWKVFVGEEPEAPSHYRLERASLSRSASTASCLSSSKSASISSLWSA